MHEESEKTPRQDSDIVKMEPWKREFYRKHLTPITINISGYHKVAGLTKKQQFIDRSSGLAAQFTRFNQTHTVPTYLIPLRRQGQNILELQKEPLVLAVETFWVDTNGEDLEVVHVWDGKEWKLDWECYAPYSNVPWTLFRSGVGKQEGEFRLLVRQRKSLTNSDKMTLLFYFPQQAGKENLEEIRKTESPEVEVDRSSEIGKKLIALFENRKKGERPLGSLLGQNDPKEMIRVTVELAWERRGEGEDEEAKMVLKKLNGVSWFGSRIQEVIAAQENVEEKGESKSGLNEAVPDSNIAGDE